MRTLYWLDRASRLALYLPTWAFIFVWGAWVGLGYRDKCADYQNGLISVYQITGYTILFYVALVTWFGMWILHKILFTEGEWKRFTLKRFLILCLKNIFSIEAININLNDRLRDETSVRRRQLFRQYRAEERLELEQVRLQLNDREKFEAFLNSRYGPIRHSLTTAMIVVIGTSLVSTVSAQIRVNRSERVIIAGRQASITASLAGSASCHPPPLPAYEPEQVLNKEISYPLHEIINVLHIHFRFKALVIAGFHDPPESIPKFHRLRHASA